MGLDYDTLRAIRSRPPLTGEHTDAILSELGVTQREISELRAAGVL